MTIPRVSVFLMIALGFWVYFFKYYSKPNRVSEKVVCKGLICNLLQNLI